MAAAPAPAATAAGGAAEGRRVAVLGAGPIGLEFALGAAQRGLRVDVFEKAGDIAGHVEAYNFVQLFSPWRMNVTNAGLDALRSIGSSPPTDMEAFPTGGEFLEQYLRPLSTALAQRGVALHFGTEVLSVGRGALLKHESIGGGKLQMPSNKPLAPNLRKETAFDLLLCNNNNERLEEGFEVVVDCGGVYRGDQASWVGRGGVPAVGERALRRSGRLFGTVPDVLGKDRLRFEGRRAMLVGAGMSAATTARLLSDLGQSAAGTGATSGTSLVWMTRSAGNPFKVIDDDVLPQRKALCEFGNLAASGGLPGVVYIGGSVVRSVVATEDDRLKVTMQTPDGEREEVVDELVSNCGFRPDTSIFQELQVHQCYASEGPMKLAATLMGGSGDCLAQVAPGADALTNPEPGFFVLGHKSYGRNSAFLLRIGHEQISSVLDLLAPTAGL